MGQKFKIVYVHIGKERGREGERKRETGREISRSWFISYGIVQLANLKSLGKGRPEPGKSGKR